MLWESIPDELASASNQKAGQKTHLLKI